MSRPLTPPPTRIEEFNDQWRNWISQFYQTIKQYGMDGDSTSVSIKTDNDSTAGNTRFFLYDVDNGTLERVSVGAADSGGVGYKVLRIPN